MNFVAILACFIVICYGSVDGANTAHQKRKGTNDEGSATAKRRREDLEECGICREALVVAGKVVTKLSCSHSFHEVCLVPWFLRNRSCPLCRATFGFYRALSAAEVSVLVPYLARAAKAINRNAVVHTALTPKRNTLGRAFAAEAMVFLLGQDAEEEEYVRGFQTVSKTFREAEISRSSTISLSINLIKQFNRTSDTLVSNILVGLFEPLTAHPSRLPVDALKNARKTAKELAALLETVWYCNECLSKPLILEYSQLFGSIEAMLMDEIPAAAESMTQTIRKIPSMAATFESLFRAGDMRNAVGLSDAVNQLFRELAHVRMIEDFAQGALHRLKGVYEILDKKASYREQREEEVNINNAEIVEQQLAQQLNGSTKTFENQIQHQELSVRRIYVVTRKTRNAIAANGRRASESLRAAKAALDKRGAPAFDRDALLEILKFCKAASADAAQFVAAQDAAESQRVGDSASEKRAHYFVCRATKPRMFHHSQIEDCVNDGEFAEFVKKVLATVGKSSNPITLGYHGIYSDYMKLVGFIVIRLAVYA